MFSKEQFDARLGKLVADQEKLICRRNAVTDFYNGIYDRYENPVLTAEHTPVFWRYDLSYDDNPNLQERLGILAVNISGAVRLNGKYCLIVRAENSDGSPFFAVAESETPVEGFRFGDYPIIFSDIPEDTVVNALRVIQHEDGRIYGIFRCRNGSDTITGIIRTDDLIAWERLPDPVTKFSPQTDLRLFPEFINGKYAFFANSGDDTSRTEGGESSFALCDNIENAVLCAEENMIPPRAYRIPAGLKDAEIIREDGNVYFYCDLPGVGICAASTTVEKLMDYTLNSLENSEGSADPLKRRRELIDKNLNNELRSI